MLVLQYPLYPLDGSQRAPILCFCRNVSQLSESKVCTFLCAQVQYMDVVFCFAAAGHWNGERDESSARGRGAQRRLPVGPESTWKIRERVISESLITLQWLISYLKCSYSKIALPQEGSRTQWWREPENLLMFFDLWPCVCGRLCVQVQGAGTKSWNRLSSLFNKDDEHQLLEETESPPVADQWVEIMLVLFLSHARRLCGGLCVCRRD